MKKSILLLIIISFAQLSTFSQQVDTRRKIEVSGLSSTEVTPDIIQISISLKEYMDGKNKINITDLENQLQKALADASVPKSALTISNISSWNYTQRKKSPDYLAAKQYSLTLHDLNKYDAIIGTIDPKGIQYTNVLSYDYSKLEALKNDLKTKAIINARDKAILLLSPLNQKLGDPLSIVEIENGNPVMMMAKRRTMSMANDAAIPDSDIDVNKIKLNYEVRITFEIIK